MQNQDRTSVYYGGFFVRLAAYLLDVTLMGIVLLVVRVPLWITALFHPDNFLLTPLIFRFSAADIFVYLLSVLYFVLLTYLSGATIGKKVFRLRVVTTDGSKLTLINVIYRETIGRYLSTVILWIGYFLVGVDTEKRGLHDMLCDTRVIYDFEKQKTETKRMQPPSGMMLEDPTKLDTSSLIETEDSAPEECNAEDEVVTEDNVTTEDDVAEEESQEESQENPGTEVEKQGDAVLAMETKDKKYRAATYNYVKE